MNMNVKQMVLKQVVEKVILNMEDTTKSNNGVDWN